MITILIRSVRECNTDSMADAMEEARKACLEIEGHRVRVEDVSFFRKPPPLLRDLAPDAAATSAPSPKTSNDDAAETTPADSDSPAPKARKPRKAKVAIEPEEVPAEKEDPILSGQEEESFTEPTFPPASVDDLRKLIAAFVGKCGDVAKAGALLRECGYPSAGKVPEDKIPAVAAQFRKALQAIGD